MDGVGTNVKGERNSRNPKPRHGKYSFQGTKATSARNRYVLWLVDEQKSCVSARGEESALITTS